jgi:hypothetical protein
MQEVAAPPWQRIGTRAPVLEFDALAREWLAHPELAPVVPAGKPCPWNFGVKPGAAQIARLGEELRWRRGDAAHGAALAALQSCR